MSNGAPVRCPLCAELWIGRGIGYGRTRPGVCTSCVGIVVITSWPAPKAGFELRAPTPAESDAALRREDVAAVIAEIRDAREART